MSVDYHLVMDDLRSSLAEYFSGGGADRRVVSAYLFGSRARGGAHRDSDVDVAVLLDWEAFCGRTERSRLAVDINSDLVAVTHCNEVDVVVLNDATPELAVRIVDEGERLACRDSEADRRFALQARLRYIDMLPFLERTRRIKVEALRA